MNKQSAVFFRNFGVFRVFRIQGPRSQIFFIQQGVETRHGAQMQTERDSKCVAKNVDRLSDEVFDTDTVLACRRFEPRRYFQNASKDRLETNKGQEVASKK